MRSICTYQRVPQVFEMGRSHDVETAREQRVLENSRDESPARQPRTSTVARDDTSSSNDSRPSTPRWYQNNSTPPHMKWIPAPLRRVGGVIIRWVHGPEPPQIHKVRPFFPRIQEFPLRLVDRWLPKRRHKILALLIYYLIWATTFSLVYREGKRTTAIEGFGKPFNIGCTSRYWLDGNYCGVNGDNCRPFNGTGMAFKCPGSCRNTWVLNPHAVGAQEINYRSFVIGGPGPNDTEAIYRGDSFICGAAIHAGIIANEAGGCGILSLVGKHQNYASSDRNGINSIEFDSDFPMSFSFKPADCKAKDPRWAVFAVSLPFTIILSLFTSSPMVFFFSIYTGIFFHVGLASDPPSIGSTTRLVSNILGKFLPATFCAVVIYKYMGVRRTLRGLTAQVEKTVLWLGGCWVGGLNNYTLDWIPIQRLNAHDLHQQPGAMTALIIIILILVVIIVFQIWYFRQEGRLIRYLSIYGILVAAILISLTLPGLDLRIHHYVLALLLLPGTSMQTRPSLFYQGLLVGLFINGIARWGFDSVLQTPGELQGDAQHNSALPSIATPNITLGGAKSTISFSWPPPPSPFDGISVLVNDVERFRGYTDEDLSLNDTFVWKRKESEELPYYFRFAYLQGSAVWDYTKAGTWEKNGSWSEMLAGPSAIGNGTVSVAGGSGNGDGDKEEKETRNMIKARHLMVEM